LTYLILKNEIQLQFYSAKDDLCVLELMNKQVLRKKTSESKNCGLQLFQTLKEPVVFMKEPAASQLFDFFNSSENSNYMPELGL
jgi:hypothetical protein